jgi:MFS family permease
MTKRYAYYALVIIFFANFLSYCDRQIVSALEMELTSAFQLNEEEFGALWTAFTIGYMVFAPVVGFLADRGSRPRIFAACIFLWSLATIASGLATTQMALFAARFCIGIGEAGCLVIGPTLISDYFPKEMRGRALSFFFLGLPLGGTTGYILAGQLVGHGARWQDAFFVAGFPGLLLAAVVWMLMDPPRSGDHEGSHARIHGVRPYLQLFRNRTLMLVILAQAFAVIILVPLLHFGVAFFQYKYKIDKNEATTLLGGMGLVAGILGTWTSGLLGDKFARRVKGAYSLLAGLGFLFGLPFMLLGFTTRYKEIGVPALGLGSFCYFLCMPAVNTQIANCVPAKQRAMAFALAVFILHLLGDTSAPLIFGHTIEVFGGKQAGRQQAFVLFSFAMLLAGVCCLLAVPGARRDEERARAEDLAD